MEDERPESSSINWSAVSKVYHNLPVIWCFLMTWAVNNTEFSPDQLINLYKVCLDIAWLLRNDKYTKEVLHKLVRRVYCRNGQFHHALQCCNQLMDISKRTKDKQWEGITYNCMGDMYSIFGKYQEATKCYEDYLELCRHTGNLTEEAEALCALGDMHRSLGESYEAMSCFKNAFQTGDLSAKANALSGIGNVHYVCDEYDEAMKYYRDSLQIFQEAGNTEGEGRVLYYIGNVHQSLGKYTEALRCYHDCEQICQQTGDLAGQYRALRNIGNVHQRRGESREAKRFYEDALPICFQIGNFVDEGDMLGNIGNLHRLRGEYGEALVCYEKSLKIFQQTGNMVEQMTAQNNIGSVHFCRGEYDEAMKCFKDSLQSDKFKIQGLSLYNIGNVFKSRGKYSKAMRYYEDALEIFRRIGDLTEKANTLNNIGNLHLSRGEYRKVMECYKDSLRVYQETGNLDGLGNVMCGIGIVQKFCKQYDKAMECFKNSLHLRRVTRNLDGEGITLGNLGTLYEKRGEYEKAMKCHQEALQIHQKTGNLTQEGNVLVNIGNVYLSRVEYGNAMESFSKALQIYKDTGLLLEEGKVHNNMGALLMFVPDFVAAEEQLRGSISCFERIFSMLSKQCQSKVSIVDTYFSTYRLLTDLLVQIGKPEDALVTLESGRSQVLRENIIDKYEMTHECPITDEQLKDWHSLISSDSTLLSYCFTRSHFFAFLLSPVGQLTVEEISKENVARVMTDPQGKKKADFVMSCVSIIIVLANDYLRQNRENTFEDRSFGEGGHNEYLRERNTDEETETQLNHSEHQSEDDPENANASLPSNASVTAERSGFTIDPSAIQLAQMSGENLLKELYNTLITPVESKLDQDMVAVIPDGPLFFVPFAALQAPDGRFLCETKRIRIGPSLATLKLLESYPANLQSAKRALIVGGPHVRNVMRHGEFTQQPFSDLPYACEEAANIGELLKERPLTESAATKEAVLNRLREGVAVIHLATHGSGESGELLLAPGPRTDQKVPTEADYMLTVKEIASCNIDAQLVVLSCCHTGLGELRAEGVVGLARAFLEAGARSVLATLWQVSDQGTLYFMDSFYRHLTSGKSACTSLQEAMREMRAMPRWSHWSYWGSFFILGHDVSPFNRPGATS